MLLYKKITILLIGFLQKIVKITILLQLLNSLLASESHREASKVYFKEKEIKYFLF